LFMPFSPSENNPLLMVARRGLPFKYFETKR